MSSFLGEQSLHLGDLGAPVCLTTAPCRKQLRFKLVAAFALRWGAADGGSDIPWTDPGPPLFGRRRGAWVTATGLGSVLAVLACPVGRGLRSSPFPCEHSEGVCGSDSAPPPLGCQLPLAGSLPQRPTKMPISGSWLRKVPWTIGGRRQGLLPVGPSEAGHGPPGRWCSREPRRQSRGSWKEFPSVRSCQACVCFISARGSVLQKHPATHSCFQKKDVDSVPPSQVYDNWVSASPSSVYLL